MKFYILRRLISLIPVLFLLSLITFGLLYLTPGDPAEIILSRSGVEPTREAVEALKKEMGLDKSFYLRYAHWLGMTLQGNLGRSYRTGEPVTGEILSRLPATMELSLAAVIFMLIIAFPAGILASLNKDKFIDNAGRIAALLGVSLPGFWLGLILIYLFSMKMKIFPVVGRGGISHLILPAITLGFGMAAIYSRLLRATMLEALSQDYIQAAYARGIHSWRVITRHALKNAILPIVTLFGMSFGNLLGGAVIVETVFAWPGVGKLVVDSIFERDFPIIQGFVLFMGLIYILTNLLVDITYTWIDPRINLGSK